MTGTVFDVKELAVHDGPGLRTTVFLKGCPLRCIWCHNPEGLSVRPQLMEKSARCRDCGLCRVPCGHPDCQPFGRCLHICPENCLTVTGRTVEAEELERELRASAARLTDLFGGFTFSGGEPLAQPDFLLEMAARLSSFHLAVETSGYAPHKDFSAMLRAVDLVIMDVKLADPEAHKRYTGVENGRILENLAMLQRSGKPHILRTPLVPGITDTEENLEAIRALVGDSPWEKLPYNGMAGAKWKMLGMPFAGP